VWQATPFRTGSLSDACLLGVVGRTEGADANVTAAHRSWASRAMDVASEPWVRRPAETAARGRCWCARQGAATALSAETDSRAECTR
jgi:hypothetical protein